MYVKYFVCTVSVRAIVLYLGGQTGSISPVSAGLQLRQAAEACWGDVSTRALYAGRAGRQKGLLTQGWHPVP